MYGSDQTVTLDKENNVKAFSDKLFRNLDDKIFLQLQALLRNKAENDCKKNKGRIEKRKFGKSQRVLWTVVKKDLFVYEKGPVITILIFT